MRQKYLEYKGDWTAGALLFSCFRRFKFLFQNPLLGLFPLLHRGVRPVPVDDQIKQEVAKQKLQYLVTSLTDKTRVC